MIYIYILAFIDTLSQIFGIKKRPPGQSNGLISPFLETIRIGHAKKWINGNKILDCGCGRGRLLDLIGPNYNYTGIDMDPQLINYLSSKYPKSNFIHGDMDKILELIKDKKFDTIILAALIEHISDPISLISNLVQLLKPNGTIIITTPNPKFETIYHYGSKFGFFDKHADDDHEDLLSLKTLDEMIKKSGLSLVKGYRFLFAANQIIIGKKTTSG